ncbi:uclacyanin-2 [Genlisea aurea]|uniref:Uclacyanin-2 n=1 Tax=Genlisea aurea TaxID=192259 RepID=S8E3I9_9LAMI|nr:uclacyanin-2 [Genlisea aurea]
MASRMGFFFLVVIAVATTASVSGFQFDVGGEMGWRKPTGKEPETYNEWAARNRFRVGDQIVFKYENDSVLLVTSADYLNCMTTNPVSRFEDGDTVFDLDRPGYFFFLSGYPGHCQSGQRLILDVIHLHDDEAAPPPGFPPSPEAGGRETDDSGQTDVSSSAPSPIIFFFPLLLPCLVSYKLM